MPGEAARAEKIGEIETSGDDNAQALGAPSVKRFACLVPVNEKPRRLTEEERFPSKSNFYGD